MAERLADFARVSGWKGRIARVPAAELPEAERMPQDFVHHLIYDTTRIHAELGYAEVTPREEALHRIIALEMIRPPLKHRLEFELYFHHFLGGPLQWEPICRRNLFFTDIDYRPAENINAWCHAGISHGTARWGCRQISGRTYRTPNSETHFTLYSESHFS